MITNERAWKLLRIALPIAGLIVIFFSGIFPLEELLGLVPSKQLTASVTSTEVVALTNENRIEDHLPALATSPLLTQAAQLKADDMAANSYYAHVSPDGKTPLYWLELVGYHYLNAGENLVIDRTTSEEVVSAWMNSADHRENILRPQFTEIGVGVAQGVYEGQATTYVVQEFGTPYPSIALVRKPVATTVTPAVPTPVVVPTQPTLAQQSTPVTIFKPEPLPTPVIPTVKTTKTQPKAPTKTNTLVNNVAALAAPVTETIQVHITPLSLPMGVSSSSESMSTSTPPVFNLPAASNTVVMVPVASSPEPDTSLAAPQNIQTALGKQRVEYIRTQILSFWASFKTFIL
ncbi:MAG: hypothetical protein JWN49_453 [Parcubacteria group bacterium]|nr:hypothetical protein [Parcubacteria group bacterium]